MGLPSFFVGEEIDDAEGVSSWEVDGIPNWSLGFLVDQRKGIL
jgi:hypothetical protein